MKLLTKINNNFYFILNFINYIFLACYIGNKEIVKLLIENNADLKAKNKRNDTALTIGTFYR